MPTKGDAAGASWEVGAESAPPSAALATNTGFVLPVQVSNQVVPPAQLSVLASLRTRKHIHAGAPSASGSSEDPWANGQDPWAKFRSSQGEIPKATAGATAKIKEVHQQLRQEVDEAVHASLAERKQLDCATEGRFQQLETSLTELRTQSQKFESWFSEAGKRMDQTSLEVGALKTAMQSQQQELGHLQGQMAAQGEMIQNTVSQAVVTMRSDLNSQLSTQLNAQMEFRSLFRLLLLALQVTSGAASHHDAAGSLYADPVCPSQVGVRYGEALHPGPAGPLSFSLFAANPSGLRGKEAALLEHGSGVYLIAETQLSAVTQKSCQGQISALGRASGKHWRTHFGEAAQLRANSDWAGAWTGVATVSEFPSCGIRVQWPPDRQCLHNAASCGFDAFAHRSGVRGAPLTGAPPGPCRHRKAATAVGGGAWQKGPASNCWGF